MSIINNAHGENAYAVLQIIYDYVSSKKVGVTKDDILEYCAGRGNNNLPAVSDESEKVVTRNVSFWSETGLFALEGGKYSIPEQYRVNDMGKLHNVLRKILFSQENNPKGVLVNSNSSPLIRPLCAMLLLNVYEQPEGWTNRDLQDEFKKYFEGDFTINNEDATGFEKIAKYLGFMTCKGSTRFQIDPTQVVENELPQIFKKTPELQFRDFLSKLADLVPVLDTGIYCREVLKHMIENGYNWTLRERQITTALSRALLRLDAKGTLELKSHSDGDYFELLGPDNKKIKEVTLVTFNGEILS